jgi:hypothetical protein
MAQGSPGKRASRSDDREKIPGLVPASVAGIFVTLLLSPDNRGLTKTTDKGRSVLHLLKT